MQAQRMTRRTFVTLGATALAMGLFGCGGKAETETDGGTDAGAQGSEAVPVTGGWEVNADVPMSALTAEQQAVFDKASEGYVGMDLLPVCVLGTQTVAGTNYAFLCLGTSATAEPEAGWYVAVAYEDLEGTCEMSSVEQIDVGGPAEADASVPEGLTGGWAVAPKVTDDTVAIPEEAASAFAAGGEGYTGMDLSPLALLATQVVAGTNYRILCVGASTVPDAESELSVVDVYEDLEGKAEYSDIRTFDLLAYV